jgi:hypothetical protein
MKQTTSLKSESVTENPITKQNEDAIKELFSFYGEETPVILSKFIFDMLAEFTNGGNWEDEYKEECVLNFRLLHDLVTGLQPDVKTITNSLN